MPHITQPAAAAKLLQLCPTLCDPHRRQPTRLCCPWDSPVKNTGVSCHFPLQCMKVKSESEVARSCPTRSDPIYCSLPGSSVHGIFQARVLEWGAFSDTASRFDFNAHILITAPQCLSLGLCIAPTSTFLPLLLASLPLPIP